MKYPARWHFAGKPVVYTGESSTGALLEVCSNTASEDLRAMFTLLRIVGPELEAEEVSLPMLPDGWVMQPEVTQRMGSDWIERGRRALLRVPSALVPESWNYLLNPAHADAWHFSIDRAYDYPFDRRLRG